ncbi:alpha/beta hydrolase [Nocardia sp. NPDC056000]|uniref:alpha/beta hydrolase n=1 Tax=Nocardia sp. NPDC056000 TaxID=3345674 RepID=UPI0035E1204A
MAWDIRVAAGMKVFATTASVVALTMALGACSGTQSDSERLQRFYDQKLVFASCDGYATTASDEKAFADPRFGCGRLEVPRDYADPGGATMRIAVLKVPARGERIGSLLLNPGGPGGPGMGMAAAGATTWAQSKLSERFDLVGFDPRGVGASSPSVRCYSDAEDDSGAAVFPTAATVGRFTDSDTRAVVDRCAKGSGGRETLAHLGTRDAARDMDILRAAVGDTKLSYFGQSYGTRLGAVYAELFPDRVRAMVLDGGIDPTTGTSERRISQFTSFQRAFDAMAADCVTRPDCPLGTDASQAVTEFQGIVRPLLDHPIPAGDNRIADYPLAVGSVIAGLYDSAVWPVITAGLAQIRTGHGDTLRKIGDAFGGRGADGRWPNIADANYAINCMDEQRHSPEQETDLRRDIYRVAPFLDPGRGADGARDGCEFWPATPTLSYPYSTGIRGLPPTLTISITGDPATPYEGGFKLAAALGGTALTVEGNQHTVAFAATSACVNKAVEDYLVELRSPAADTRCKL